MIRRGFDTSPLLNLDFAKSEIEMLKTVAPESLDGHETDLLIHTVKRIHKNPTASMIVFATQQSGADEKQVLAVWNAMWAKA
jgi:hypothetical protein